MGSLPFLNVLVINGEPFNDITATGITMSNLFKGWPRDRIFQIYTANVVPNSNICANNLRLSSRDLKPFCYFANRAESNGGLGDSAGGGARNGSGLSSSKGRSGFRDIVRKGAVPFLDFLPYQIRRENLAVVREFKPDVIYSMLGSIRMVRLVSRLAKELGIPVVPHFMDDWISTYSVPGRSVGSPFHVRYLQSAVKQLFNSVPLAMSIGELMSREYSNRYSRSFYDFMNPVEVPEFFLHPEGRGPGRVVRFVYVGGLHLGRAECLMQIATQMQNLKNQGLPLALDIFAPLHDADAATRLESIGDVVTYKGSVRPEGVGTVLSESDVAIHVESFSDECAEYTRLSVSTKIPQYFAAGIPVLAYGPSSLASCQYVGSSKAGVLVDRTEGSALGDVIRMLVLDSDVRTEMGKNGWAHARKSHEVAAVRDRFREVLLAASKASAMGAVV